MNPNTQPIRPDNRRGPKPTLHARRADDPIDRRSRRILWAIRIAAALAIALLIARGLGWL